MSTAIESASLLLYFRNRNTWTTTMMSLVSGESSGQRQ